MCGEHESRAGGRPNKMIVHAGDFGSKHRKQCMTFALLVEKQHAPKTLMLFLHRWYA